MWRRGLAMLAGLWALIAAIGLGLVIGTIGVLPFAPIPRGKRERFTLPPAQFWAWLVVRAVLCSRVEVRGQLDLRPGEGAILICNHRSWLDPLLLIAWGRSNGLSKREIFWLPFIGIYGWLAGAIFFDRSRQRARIAARDDVKRLVRGGMRVQVFPEGTRSRDGRLLPKVHLALVKDAWEDDLPVVACAVMHTEATLPPGRFEAWPFQRSVLVFGPTLRRAQFATRGEMAQAAWGEVVKLVQELEPSLPSVE